MDETVLYQAVIELIPRTKKNSQQIMYNNKTKRPFVAQSKDYQKYAKGAMLFLNNPPHINTPVNVKMMFYMPTRRIVDESNLQSACLDILIAAGVIEDDNSRIVVSHDGSRVLYDKENPRTEIVITSVNDNEEPDNSMYKMTREK